MGKVARTFKLRRYGDENRVGGLNRVRFFQGNEEVGFLPLQRSSAFAKVRDRQRAAKIKAPDVMAIERPRQTSFVIKKAVGVERFIT